MSVTREEFDLLKNQVDSVRASLTFLNAELNLHRESGDHDLRYGLRNDVLSFYAQLENILGSATFDGGNGLVLRAPDGKRYMVSVNASGQIITTVKP